MNILVLGSGQLARMMSLSSTHLGIHILAFDVGSNQVINPVTLEVQSDTFEQAIDKADFITAEFEHIPLPVLAQCEATGKLFPNAESISTGGDRAKEKALLDKAAVPCAPYRLITEKQHLVDAVSALKLPLVIKTCQAGYDGKGQWRLKHIDELDGIWSEMADFIAAGTDSAPHTIIAEQMIPFEREVSIIGVRDKNGQCKIYPLTENQHTDGVLTLSIAGKEKAEIQAQAESAFENIANTLNYVGVLAIEFFDVGGQLLVNEIAPRVHNSGHWTQQGCHVSQFENHIRAVAGLPTGDTSLIRPTAMINVLGQKQIPSEVLAHNGCTSHWYGKSAKPGRKMGHINVSGQSLNDLGKKLIALSEILPEEDYPGILSSGQSLTS